MPRLTHSLSPRDIRAALRSAACHLAAEIHDPPPSVSVPTSEACYTGAGAFVVEFRPGGTPAPTVAPSPSPAFSEEQRRRSRLEDDILRVFGAGASTGASAGACTGAAALKGVVIARRLGRVYDSYLRATLARMVRDGRLRRATNGGGYAVGDAVREAMGP